MISRKCWLPSCVYQSSFWYGPTNDETWDILRTPAMWSYEFVRYQRQCWQVLMQYARELGVSPVDFENTPFRLPGAVHAICNRNICLPVNNVSGPKIFSQHTSPHHSKWFSQVPWVYSSANFSAHFPFIYFPSVWGLKGEHRSEYILGGNFPPS